MYLYSFWANGGETKNIVIKNTQKRPSFIAFGTMASTTFFNLYSIVNISDDITELTPVEMIQNATGLIIKTNAHNGDSSQLRMQLQTPDGKGCQVYILVPQSTHLITEW